MVNSLVGKKLDRYQNLMHEQLRVQKTLANHYLEARRKNPSYSLRSFAKRLTISPSALSEILNGKRQVSKKLAEKLLQSLNVSQKEITDVLSMFPARRHVLSSLLMKPLNWEKLEAAQYQLLSEWHHFAILSLLETKGAKSKIDWIAERLSLPLQTVEKAVSTMEKLSLLSRDPATGNLKLTGANYTTSDEIASQALKKAHAQNLELAKKSLLTDPLAERDFTAITMAIDPEKLPQAKRMIREFRDRLCSYLESGQKKEVYKLCLQLIPLSKPGEK